MDAGAIYLYGKAAALYDSAGNIYGAIESIRDITDRKNAEQTRERLVKELESKNAEMERFTYTVSHDLRSPLITVSGLVGFLKSDLVKGNTTRIDTYLVRISSAIAKMDNLLKDTLELSRIGRVANPPERVAFDDIVQDALSQV
jgi:light-regulated signal transduction histidine kinase (bacteriophytochrome)